MPVSASPYPYPAIDKLSLTPQRKHHKLLKDGSGSEVWPEPVELIFVEGLKKYWESPWASYSRGRSRWRNQFLVDYLQSMGISRSKKQVASHIQVLRNMWKGEPQYHLVASGDDVLRFNSDSKSPSPVKSELSDTSPFDGASIPLPPRTPLGSSNPLADSRFTLPPLSNPRVPLPDPSQPFLMPSAQSSPVIKNEPILLPSPFSSVDLASEPASCLFQSYAPPSLPASTDAFTYDDPCYQYPMSEPARLSAVTVSADGMTPVTVNTNDYMTPSPSSTPIVQFSLKISTVDDLRCPPSLAGFFVELALTHSWTSAKTVTRVFAAGACVSHNAVTLQNPIYTGASEGTDSRVLCLPESELSRCRWLNAAVQFRISQEIHVDDSPVAFFIYDLVRNGGSMPSATIVGIQAKPKRYPNLHQRSPLNQTMISGSRTHLGVPPVMPTSVSF